MTTTQAPRQPERTAPQVPDRWRLGPAFVPKGRYTDPEFLDLELERLFPRTWLNACRVDEVERVGDYVDFEIGDQSIVVVRTEDGPPGLLQRLSTPGHAARPRAGPDRRVPLPLPRLALEPRRLAQVPGRRGQLRSPAGRGALPARSAGSTPGAAGCSSTWTPDAEPLARLPRPDPVAAGGLQARGHADRLVQVGDPPGQLEDRTRRVHRELARAGHPPAAAATGQAARRRRPSPSASSTARPSTSCSATTPGTPTSSATAAKGTRPGCGPPTGSNPEAIYTQRRVLAARARSPLPEDRPGRRGRAAHHPRPPTARGQRHLPAAPQEARPGRRHRLPRRDRGAAQGGHVRLARLARTRSSSIDMGCCLTYRARPNGHDPDSCIFDVQGLELPPSRGPRDRPPAALRGLASGLGWARSSSRTSPTCPR